MPVAVAGKSGRGAQIDLAAALPWVINHREAPPGSQRERLAKAQAEKVEMENELRRGRMILADQVEETIFELAAYLAREHEAMPGRLANELAGISEPAIIRARLLAELRAIRDGIATHSARTSDACGHLAEEFEDQPPAAGEDGERLGGSDSSSANGERGAGEVAQQ